MRYKNYLSDFEFYQELRNGQVITDAPFELIYYVPGEAQKLVASFNGQEFKNCRPEGNGVIVMVDHSRVQLGIGRLRCTARYYLNNSNYAGGIYEPVSGFEVGIALHRGKSDDMDDFVATPLPSYHVIGTGGGGYQPPIGGIPRKDLSDDVQTSLRKADTALQEHQDLSEYAKKTELPTKTSQLTNDSGYVTDTKIVNQTAEAAEIQPNVLNVWGEVTSLDITLAEPTDNTIVNEYMVQFTSGATATTLTLPSTIKWMAAPNIQPNKTYQLSVINNLGVIGEFSHE